jgi:hypothetical protein
MTVTPAKIRLLSSDRAKSAAALLVAFLNRSPTWGERSQKTPLSCFGAQIESIQNNVIRAAPG